MSAMDNARRFFEICETAGGWAGCREYVADGAPFEAQADALEGVDTVEAYCEWMKGFATEVAPGAEYELHAAAWDETRRRAVFFATYHATHTGDGGPVPATGRGTASHYVYVIEMDADDRVASMVKIWNDHHATRELGWH